MALDGVQIWLRTANNVLAYVESSGPGGRSAGSPGLPPVRQTPLGLQETFRLSSVVASIRSAQGRTRDQAQWLAPQARKR